MTVNLNAGVISNTATVTQSNMETYLEGFVSIMKETIGGSQSGTAIQLPASPGAIPYSDNLCTYIVDTVGGTASSGTLQAITPTANTRDGMVVMIQMNANARPITLSNASGVSGQIFTKDGNPLVLSDIRQWVMLRYTAATNAWNVIDNDETFRVNQILGGVNATTLTNSGTAGNITPTAAMHQVTTSVSGSQTIANALTTSINQVGRILILQAANAPTYLPQLLHMNGGAGQFQMSDSLTFSLATQTTAIMFQLRSVASVLTWVEIARWVPSSVGNPSASVAGQSIVGNGSGAWVLDTPPVSSPGYVEVLDTSANGTYGRRWGAADPGMPGGRLTMTSGQAVTTGTGSSIYYTPHRGQYIPQWNPTSGCWIPTKFSEMSILCSTLTASTFYYMYVTSTTIGSPVFSASTTAPTMQNGMLCMSAAPASLYVGAFYNSSAQTAIVAPSATITYAQLYIRNYYNRIPIKLSSLQGTLSYTFTTQAVRPMYGGAIGGQIVAHPSTAYRDYIIGKVNAVWQTSVSGAPPGFGLNISSSSFYLEGQYAGGLAFPASGASVLSTTLYVSEVTQDFSTAVTAGALNTIYGLEYGSTSATHTIYGSDTSNGTGSGVLIDTDY